MLSYPLNFLFTKRPHQHLLFQLLLASALPTHGTGTEAPAIFCVPGERAGESEQRSWSRGHISKHPSVHPYECRVIRLLWWLKGQKDLWSHGKKQKLTLKVTLRDLGTNGRSLFARVGTRVTPPVGTCPYGQILIGSCPIFPNSLFRRSHLVLSFSELAAVLAANLPMEWKYLLIGTGKKKIGNGWELICLAVDLITVSERGDCSFL